MTFFLRRWRERIGHAVRKIIERSRNRWDPRIDVSTGEPSVMLSASETLRLLRSLDDPDPRYAEVPADFRHRTEHKRFKLLAEAIDEEFSCSCKHDDRMQDTAELGRIEIPETVLDSPARIVVSISNFGRMTIVALENPAAWSDAETAESMAASDRTRIEDALGRLGSVGRPIRRRSRLAVHVEGQILRIYLKRFSHEPHRGRRGMVHAGGPLP